jgi:putative heme transporter
MSEVPATADPGPVDEPQEKESSTVLKGVRRTIKVLILIFVVYYLVLPQIGGLRSALDEVTTVNPILLVVGVAFEAAALVAYSFMTRACLPPACLAFNRLLRIQLATKAVANTIPGGSAAGSALGYRLLTVAGVRGPDAGFALATSGLVSAVVLNAILWLALLISIPAAGFNPLYVTAAIVGVFIMGFFAVIVIGLVKGEEVAERALRAAARKVRWLDEERTGAVVKRLAQRLKELLSEPQLLRRVMLWATANWLLDAASLWVFLRAFGATVDPVGLFVAFGLANVLAALPITPGGLGIVEGVLIPTLVGFGADRTSAALGVAAYRFFQYWMTLPIGGISYFTLRYGPWSIVRARRLEKLRQLAAEAAAEAEHRLDWAERYGHRPPHVDDAEHEPDRATG